MVLESIFWLFCLGISFFLLLPFFTVLLSFFIKEKVPSAADPDMQHDFGCIITAYKNAEITKPLVESLLKQRYDKLHIYLVADECDLSTFDLSNPRLLVLKPDPPLRLKAKSIIYAVEQFVRPHDYIVVFDGDNLAHPDFLNTINRYAVAGHRAIQGQRTAKNLDTLYACADATGEFYKNYVERFIPYLLGSSSVISGSGMAVEAELYKSYLYGPDIQKGKDQWKKMLQEDKILQNDLLRKNEKIAYATQAVVYDEKVTTAQQVETQRSRWLFSYFQNLPNSLELLLKGALKLNFNAFFFGLITAAPPLFLQVLAAIVLILPGFFIAPAASGILLLSLFVFGGNILLVLKRSKAPREVWHALWGLPLFVWKQIMALFKMGNPNKHFKHTEHNRKLEIDQVLNLRSNTSSR